MPPVSFNLEELLEPQSAEAPSGKDPDKDPALKNLLREIREARDKASNAERELRLEASKEQPDWRPVLERGVEFTRQAKDLRVVLWLIEALLRLDAFAGLQRGFELASGIVSRYWTTLYPRPDAKRHRVLVALEGDGEKDVPGLLDEPIGDVPLVQEPEPLGFLQLKQMAQPERDQKIARISPSGHAELSEHLGRCLQALDNFEKSLTAALGSQVETLGLPPFNSVRAALKACLRLLQGVKPPSQDSERDGKGTTLNRVGEGRSGIIGSRGEAFETLERIAEFFLATEPQSPMYYLLTQAVRWGQMSLPELMSQVVPDANARAEVLRRMGMSAEEKPG